MAKMHLATPWPEVSETRRKIMRAVKGKNTKPEMIVRRLVHSMGYRYRLHRKDLPGKPDLVFGPRKKVIFVHGCFWHSHCDGVCKAASIPKVRAEYWAAKLEGNRARDARNMAALRQSGWQVLVVWECWLRDRERTLMSVQAFLASEINRRVPRDCLLELAWKGGAHQPSGFRN